METNLTEQSEEVVHKELISFIFRTNNELQLIMSNVLKKFDITRQQYNVLCILYAEYPTPLNLNSIRDQMIDRMSDASRIVERLRIKNLIERTQSDFDKRNVQIHLNDKGLSLIEQVRPAMSELYRQVEKLNTEEQEQLKLILSKISGNNS